ncbi:hypothetical protein [Roseateles sp.]|uniref:hypothetical protein n=1 Tax=Roseateles sp. TaxID=1971397 RepID=UPI003BA79064
MSLAAHTNAHTLGIHLRNASYRLVLLGLGLWAGLVPAQASEQLPTPDGGSCIHRLPDHGGQLTVENRCSEVASIYYRDTRKPSKAETLLAEASAKGDTQRKFPNLFYTHQTVLKPGEQKTFYIAPADSVRIASCLGQAKPFLTDGFQSTSDGRYVCPDEGKGEPGGDFKISASGHDIDAVCTGLRAGLIPSAREQAVCYCNPVGNSGGGHCVVYGQKGQSLTPFDQEGTVISWLKQKLRAKQQAEAEANKRLIRQQVAAIGVRG